MPVDPEDPELDLAAGSLPTRLPVAVLPGAYSSPIISQRINEAISGLAQHENAIEIGVKYTKKGESKTIQGALAVKVGDGWAVYGQVGIDIHNGDGSVEGGVRRSWGN